MIKRSRMTSAILGWIVGVALYGGLYAITPWPEPGLAYPYWAVFTNQLAPALVAVVPGVAAGYFLGRSGFTVGAASGVLTTLSVSAVSAAASWPSVLLTSHVTTTFAVDTLSATLAALLTNGLSGAAGAYMRWLSSNSAPQGDGRQAAHLGQSSSAPAPGRER